MEQNNSLRILVDGTTYIVSTSHIDSGETMIDKIVRLVRDDVKREKEITLYRNKALKHQAGCGILKG